MKPDPSGNRGRPPVRITALGYGKPSRKGWVMISLLDEREESALADALRKLGWRVRLATCDDSADLLLQGPEFVITDSSEIIELTRIMAPDTWVGTICEASEEAYAAASLVADYVLVRPVDLEDPLGLKQYGRSAD